MHCCKKISVFFLLMLSCVLASAAEHQILIKNADLKASGQNYQLNADLEISLGETIEEAINRGVHVTFVYQFQLRRPRMFWFDKVIAEATTRITLSYHALSRQYVVTQGMRQTSHEILSEAMIELVQLYDWPVFDRSVLQEGKTYEAVLTMHLDQSKLPKAIQVEAIRAKDWQLASEPFEWTPKDLSP